MYDVVRSIPGKYQRGFFNAYVLSLILDITDIDEITLDL